jgi:1,4-dihydroxy-2-naphthoate octaprenyltransferase
MVRGAIRGFLALARVAARRPVRPAAGPLGVFLGSRASAQLQFAAGALAMIGFLFQVDLAIRGVEIVAFLLLNALCGRRVRVGTYLVAAAGVVFFNLLLREGRVIVTVLGFPVTMAARTSGVAKATVRRAHRPDAGLLRADHVRTQAGRAPGHHRECRPDPLRGLRGGHSHGIGRRARRAHDGRGGCRACRHRRRELGPPARGDHPGKGADLGSVTALARWLLARLPGLIRLAFDARAWRAGLQALRAPSLVIAGFSCALGAALAWRDGRGDLLRSLLVLAAGLALQAGVNLINDFFEYRQRRVDDKFAHLAMPADDRELVEWLILFAGLGCFGAAGLAGLYLAWRAGWPLLALGLLGFAGGYGYTGEPLAYKRRGLAVPLVFLLMGVAMVGGARYAVAGDLPPDTLALSLPVSCLVSLILLANEFRDFDSDARYGIRTLSVRIGYRGATVLYFVLLALAYAGPAVLHLAGRWPRPLLVYLAMPFAIPPTLLVFRDGRRRRPIVPLVMLHHLVYGGLTVAALAI